jgi:hypothetical protein
MTLHVSVGGVSKKVIAIWVGVNGAWKKVLNGYTSISAVYKKFHSALGNIVNPLGGGLIASLAAQDDANSSTVTFNADGTITATTGGFLEEDSITGTNWFNGEQGETFQIYATLVSVAGTGVTSGVFNTWLAFPQTWGVGKAGGTTGTRTLIVTFQIRRQSDGAVVSVTTPNNYTLQASTEASGGGGGLPD